MNEIPSSIRNGPVHSKQRGEAVIDLDDLDEDPRVARLIRGGVLAEREACAQLCEEMACGDVNGEPMEPSRTLLLVFAAGRIRDRGKAKP